jgi:membrane-associated phospholipid phosphatase
VVVDCDRGRTHPEAPILSDVNAVARPVVWLLISLAILIVAGLGLHGLATLVSGEDLALVRGAAGDRSPFLTVLAHGASWLGRSAVLVPAAVVIAVAAALLRRPSRGLAVLTGVLGAIVIENAVKSLVARPRPPVHQLESVSSTSFPSGHATEATAFFLVLAVVLVRGSHALSARLLVPGAALVIIAAVALSRVYLGVHYPTDVVAGILLGGGWGVLTATAFTASGHSHVPS